MTSLQLGLFAAGAAIVGAVIAYNWLQERKIRRRIDEAFRNQAGGAGALQDSPVAETGRIEPTLPSGREPNAVPENAPRAGDAQDATDDGGYEPPLEIHARIASDIAADESESIASRG